MSFIKWTILSGRVKDFQSFLMKRHRVFDIRILNFQTILKIFC